MKIRHLFLKSVLLLILVLMFSIDMNNVFAQETPKQKELKILAIEINPYLQTKGMKVSEFFNSLGNDFNQDFQTSLLQMKEDFEYSSNGIVKCTIVGQEYLNEFPKYTEQFTLSHIDKTTGQRVYNGKDYRLDEATYLDMFGQGWYGWWNSANPVIEEGIDRYPFEFDYDYLVEKFNLVERKNNNEFDMVWIFSIDPLSAGETNMVGRNAYNVNGDVIIKDCDNFVIAGFTLARQDSALECIGHMAETIFYNVYDINYDVYNTKLEFNSVDKLNTWQRFSLCDRNAPDSWKQYGVGLIHYSPNTKTEYDWEETTPVQSTWKDWKYNYPNMTGETTLFTSSVYEDSTMSVNRAHKRWWLSLMPHVDGRDDLGYSHNWWDYIISLDFVTEINSNDTQFETSIDKYKNSILLEKGDTLSDLKFKLKYRSGKQQDFIINDNYNYLYIDNKRVIDIVNGKITALGEGKAKVTLRYDGKEASYNINVVNDKSSLYFNASKPSSWAKPIITKAIDNKLTTSKVLANLQRNISREEFCELVIKLYEALSDKSAEMPKFNKFKDTSNPEILKANYLGIVNGVDTNKFEPNSEVTREQMAVMLTNLLKVQNINPSIAQGYVSFSDEGMSSSWAKEPIQLIYKIGIMNGIGANRIAPKDKVTREQAIVMIERMLEKFSKNIAPSI